MSEWPMIFQLQKNAKNDDSHENCVHHYGRVRAILEAAGKTIGPLDLLIAAHALALDATLVTHNTREFKRVPDLNIDDWT